MSACGEFAEHVWKPGSCKNCFHPRSAHRVIGGGGSLPAVCLRNSLGGEDEDGLTSPSPYSKPTIAVRPTMMHPDAHELHADVNMNIEQQESQKSPVDRLALKKLLNLSPLYIDNDGCSKALRETVQLSPSSGTKKDYTNRFYSGHLSPLSPPVLPKDPVVISNIFVTQEQGGRGGSGVKENGSGDVYRQQVTTTRTIKSTYNGSLGSRASSNNHEVQQATVGIPLSINIITNSTSTAHSNAASSTVPASTSPETLDSLTQTSQPAVLRSPSFLSEPASLSDSSSSYRSSTDSLLGPEVFVGGQMKPDCPQSPQASSSPPSDPHSPEGQGDTEPIYAESTKRKRRPQMSDSNPQLQSLGQSQSQSQDQQQQHSELEMGLIGEGQRTKITVMAAHTEENNRTFYLTSPDSAVSTQWPHFSPTALKDPSSPAFHWPSQSIRRPCTETTTSPLPNQLTPQSSPPIPPKRNSRSPKLGTSSLSSPVSLPELPVLVLLPSRDVQGKPQVEGHSSPSERRYNKPHGGGGPGWNWEGCIQEEEEDETKREGGTEELVRGGRSLASPRATGMVNGEAVRREPRDRRMATSSSSSSSSLTSPSVHRASPTTPRTEPGTATPPPATVANNGASQGPIWSIAGAPAAAAAEEEGKHSGIMLANAAAGVTLAGAAELVAGRGAASQEASAPPPPPKKHHRVFGKLGGSSMELDRYSQQGSVESLTQSLRGLGSASLPSASTDSLPGDTRALSDSGSHDASLNCSSPFPRSPMASPGSPYPDPLPSNNLGNQLQPPPLPEKKMVNRTVSAPDAAGSRPFVRAYPRLPFTGSESSVCRPGDFGGASRSSLPSSPVDPRPIFSSSESLERCHAPLSRPSRSRTLDEPLQNRGRLGVHCRGSLTCSSSPQLSVPFSASGLASAPGSGSSLQLQTLLSNIDSREGVYSKLGGLYAESLRRLALKCEDHFTRSQKNPLRFDESNWSLFKLTCNKPSCNTGDAVYYSAACASDPSNSYAVKICKSPCGEAKQGHLYGLSVQQSMPPHFNIQQDSGHFIACVPQSMLPSDEASLATSNPPVSSQPQPQSQPPGPDQVDRERVVVITREVPHQSAADFVREWAAFHQAQPEVYERRVCFLLLQLCNGLEHLKEHGVTHRDLCLENLLLVTHPSRQLTLAPSQSQADDQRYLPRLLISNFAKAKRRSSDDAASAHTDPRFRRDHARLAPEIVSAAQYRKFDEFQAGILIYELLHQPNPFEVSPALREQDYRCQDLPAIPAVSLYSAGLQGLARLLLQPDPIKRIHIQEAKRVLQSLLWGPRRDLMEQQWERQGPGVGGDGSRHEGLLNWLDVKRALLMMKFAERSLEPERNAELEDWLCCQYFSSAHPLSLCHTAELMYSLK